MEEAFVVFVLPTSFRNDKDTANDGGVGKSSTSGLNQVIENKRGFISIYIR